MKPEVQPGFDPVVADNITCLTCLPGHTATKTFVATPENLVQQINFDAGWRFWLDTLSVRDIFELSQVLTCLECMPETLVIRGDPVNHGNGNSPLRRTGAGDLGHFTGNFMTPSQGRYWILIDIDKLQLPPDLVLCTKSLPDVVGWVVSLLPEELRDVSCHWQLSSSAGVFDTVHVSIHFWFWLSCPVTDGALKAWASTFNAGSAALKIDDVLFQHVQQHYTAKPLFKGMPDPFPVRSGLLEGSKHSATLAIPEVSPPLTALPTRVTRTCAQSSDVTGFKAHLARIGDHPGGAGFRRALLSASASYVATHGAAGTDPETLFHLLSDAVLMADSSGHTQEEIQDRASREAIMPMIRSAIAKFGYTKLVGTPNLLRDVPPLTYQRGPQTSKELLATEIDRFFCF